MKSRRSTPALAARPSRQIAAAVSAAVALALHAAAAAQAPATTEAPVDEVIVTGLSFKYNIVETANKFPLSVKDTPQSVKIITEDMLDFSGINNFEDIYKIDAGSHSSHAQDGFARNYLRGYKLEGGGAIKLDGMRMPGVINLDLAPFERFEVIKGATSTMYGQALIGGTVNAVSKKPTADFGGAVSLEGGSWGHYRGQFDVHGALTDSERLSGRLVAAYLDEDSYLDFAYTKHTVIAPSLKYEFTPDTSVTLLTQYQKQEFLQSFGFGVQIVGDSTDPASYSIPDVPRSVFAALPTGFKESDLMFGRVTLEHHFANSWQVRGNVQYGKTTNTAAGSLGLSTDADGFTYLETYFNDRESESYGAEVNLFGKVEMFGREHTLFFGADNMKDVDPKGYYSGAGLPGYVTGFSVFNPDHSLLPNMPQTRLGFTPEALPMAGWTYIGGSNKSFQQESGFTAQALIKATDRLSFLLGGRYSSVKFGSNFGGDADPTAPPAEGWIDKWNQHATTFQTGAIFAVTDDINVYASYGQTFVPRLAYAVDPDNPPDPLDPNPSSGQRVGPEEGVAYELGIKGEAFGRQLAWSAAIFDDARTNISESDPRYPFANYVVLLGKQRARGVEFDMQGEIAKGWDVYLSAAYLDNEFVDGNFTGYSSFVAPRTGLSVFSSYEIQSGGMQGLGFGGGVVYKDRGSFKPFFGGAQGQSFDGLFEDPVEVDARVFYKRERWNYQLSITNLLDSKYYSPEGNNFYYALGVNPGRQVIGKVSYDF